MLDRVLTCVIFTIDNFLTSSCADNCDMKSKPTNTEVIGTEGFIR